MLCTVLSLCHFLISLAFPHLADSQKIPCQENSKSLTMSGLGNRERTFIMLKPDAVHRGLIGEIIKRFEQKGFKLVAMKMMHVSILLYILYHSRVVLQYLVKTLRCTLELQGIT